MSTSATDPSVTSAVDTTSADAAATTQTTDPADTTTDGSVICGDGEIEGDEICDDGNDVPGDGCTECLPSFTAAWVRTFGGPRETEGALSIAAHPDAIVAGGTLASDAGDLELWLEVLDEDGENLGRLLTGGTAQADDSVFDVSFAADGSIRFTGTIDDGGAPQAQVLTRKVSLGLDIEWTAQAGGELVDRGTGVGSIGSDTAVGGVLGNAFENSAWFGRYDDAGQLVDAYLCDCGPFGGVLDLATSPTSVRAIVIDTTTFYLWGFDGPLSAGPTLQVPLEISTANISLDVAPGGDTVVCGEQTGGNDARLWLARFDDNGDEIWTTTHDLGDGDQTCFDVVVRDQIFVVGSIREDEKSGRGLVARLDLGTGDLVASEELVIEDSVDTRVLAIDVVDGVPYVAGTYAVNALDDDAFVARLVP